MVFRSIVLLILCLDVGWWLWADRRLRPLPQARWWRVLLGLFTGAQLGALALMIVWPSAMRGGHSIIPVPVLASVFLWHILVLPTSVLVYGIVGVGIRTVLPRPRGEMDVEDQDCDGCCPTRRQVLVGAAVALPPLALPAVVGAAMRQLGTFRINPVELSIPSLPAALDGMTIAHLSDVHVGHFTSDAMLAEIVDRTNALKADLVLLTGDLIDLAVADLPRAMEMVRSLKARCGLAMCIGNHDMIEDPLRFVRGVRAADIPLLLEQTLTVPVGGAAVELCGSQWGRGRNYLAESVRRVHAQRNGAGFPILLAHHPHGFDAAAEVGFPLTLSGHTHGGQLMLNEQLGAGPVLFRYWTGLYHKPGASLVVSNGVGNWFPLRIHAPAEIVHLTLRSGGATA